MYQTFSKIYDLLNDEEFYQQWYAFIKPHLEVETIIDMGCGNGRLLEKIAPHVPTMIGVDTSKQMLEVAAEKLAVFTNNDIQLYEEDMATYSRKANSVDLIISSCDSMNYLLNEESLNQLFANVEKMLVDGGKFIFDIHSNATFLNRFMNWTYGDAHPEVSVIWNTFTDDEVIFEHELTFFIKDEDEKYRRFDEMHVQRYYQEAEIEELARTHGFTISEKASDFEKSYDIDGERTFYVLEKKRG